MPKVFVGMIAATALVGLSACARDTTIPEPATALGGADMSPQAAMVEEGRRLAEFNCARCHAVGAAGVSANPAAPPLRELSNRYPGALLADAFPERIRVGHPAMPDFAFSDSQVDALLAYLLSIQVRQGV